LSEAQKRTPRPSPEGRDAKSFPLSPTDGYVLSRIDGTLNETDLTASTGLPEVQVQTSLAKLESLGLIVFESAPPTPARSSSGPDVVAARSSPVQVRTAAAVQPGSASRADLSAARSSTTAIRSASPIGPSSRTAPGPPTVASPPSPSGTTRAPPPALPSAPPPLSEAEKTSLTEDTDLDEDLRKRLLDMHRALDRRDYYALLGIEEGADRKAIKRAYYELAAAFHPDRYFRKRLGSFKVRMEEVFAKLTIAHDTLSDRERRSEYNAYLAEQRISSAIEENLARGLTEAQRAEESVVRAVSADVGISVPASAPETTLAPQIDVAARREALARRLLGGNQSRTASTAGMRAVGGSIPAGSPSAAEPPMGTANAVNALKRRYEERVAGAKANESRKFAGQAEAALGAGDLIAAANAFRIAASLTPHDADLASRAQQAKVKADALLSETYTKQAHYEETHDQWTEAARSWARVCKVCPDDARPHERAAHAVLKSSGDLHDGARFAQRACELDPKNPFYRITLASCYTAAGLALNARRELDTAAQLAPHDDSIQAMIMRVGQPAGSHTSGR
jgi:curved DNA-binding protein CbpA